MKYCIYIVAMLLLTVATGRSLAQSKIKDGTITGSSALPDTNAIMELESARKGLLLPRVPLTGLTANAPLGSHIAGMTVYNTATTDNISEGYYYNNGARWIMVAGNTIGDIKQALQPADHEGWIKLDGRAVNTLTATQQARADALGFSPNLPDATNAYLVQNGAAAGSISGTNSRMLARNQLPDNTLVFSGTTNSAGNHMHSYVDRGSSGVNITAASVGVVTAVADNASDEFNTPAAGAHTHTFSGATESLNGNVTQQSLNITPRSLSVNTFVYLGL